jgi:hypothetical protein
MFWYIMDSRDQGNQVEVRSFCSTLYSSLDSSDESSIIAILVGFYTRSGGVMLLCTVF